MPQDERPGSSKPSFVGGLMLSLLSIFLTVLVAEGLLRWWNVRELSVHGIAGLTFLSEGRNFRVHDWGGFTHNPNSLINIRSYHITNLRPMELVKEYDYNIRTNSYGLVQLRDISSSTPGILFLGDSFTEGQGAPPWFYWLESAWPTDSRYQLINGGIVATGVESWSRLYKAISSESAIAKVVIIFISDDWTRPPWQFTKEMLECLNAARKCRGPEVFYGLPDDPTEAETHVNRLALMRANYFLQKQDEMNFIERTAAYQKLLRPVYKRSRELLGVAGHTSDRTSMQFEISKKAAKGMVQELGADNVLFISLPQKNELSSGRTWYGEMAKRFITDNKFRLVDGFDICALTVRDFHKYDGHPNAIGYSKIALCVERAVREAIDPT